VPISSEVYSNVKINLNLTRSLSVVGQSYKTFLCAIDI
jgi:hypothetical protein